MRPRKHGTESVFDVVTCKKINSNLLKLDELTMGTKPG